MPLSTMAHLLSTPIEGRVRPAVPLAILSLGILTYFSIKLCAVRPGEQGRRKVDKIFCVDARVDEKEASDRHILLLGQT